MGSVHFVESDFHSFPYSANCQLAVIDEHSSLDSTKEMSTDALQVLIWVIQRNIHSRLK